LSTNYSAQTGVSTNLIFVPDPNNSSSQVLQMTLGANDLVAGSSHRTEIIPYGGNVIVDTTAPANSINARWYAFNFYIPSTWVPITGGNVFAQIHGNNNVTTGNPVVALGATGSNLWLQLNSNTNLFSSATPPTPTNQTSNTIQLGTVTTGTWYLFVVYADWSYTPGKGSLSIWLNGTSIYSNTNTPNCYDTSYGSYPSNYAKTGIYAWNGLSSGQASAYVLSRGIVVADPSATYTQVVATFPTTN
jgi:Polysaccharide lyase